MSAGKRIESGDGDYISASCNETHVVVTIAVERAWEIASIWLTAEQADEHIRQVAAARVELSKARPQS